MRYVHTKIVARDWKTLYDEKLKVKTNLYQGNHVSSKMFCL